ncbi:hypothetical protein ACOJIV_28280 [Haloarcula sp. AONF1]
MSCKQVGQCSGRSWRFGITASGIGGLSPATGDATDVGSVGVADIAQRSIDGTDSDESLTTIHN